MESYPNATPDLNLNAIRSLDSFVERKESFQMELEAINSFTASGNVSSSSVGASGSRPKGSEGTSIGGVRIHSYF